MYFLCLSLYIQIIKNDYFHLLGPGNFLNSAVFGRHPNVYKIKLTNEISKNAPLNVKNKFLKT